MSQLIRIARVVLFAVSALAFSSTIASAGETGPGQAACNEARARLGTLQLSNASPSEIAAAQSRVNVMCPHVSQLPVCGTDWNGTKTAKVSYVEVYSSKYAKWCVDASYWQPNATTITPFFSYYDKVVPTLISLFHLDNMPLPILVEVPTPTPNGTACACAHFGVKQSIMISGASFGDTYSYPQAGLTVPGYWGYLLTLHESINAFTGQVGGGWPTDFWADDISPFPNAMDEEVMRAIGKDSPHNQTLLNAAEVQHWRFSVPGQKKYDPLVAMYVDFFNRYGGFPAYSHFFKMVQDDQIQWLKVSGDRKHKGDSNYSAQLAEYVIAYLSMAFGTESDLTSTFVNAGVGKLTAVKKDGTVISPYTVDPGAVQTIANAHCSIADAKTAGASYASELANLQRGDFVHAIASHGTLPNCPRECAWRNNKCVAKWDWGTAAVHAPVVHAPPALH